MKVESKSEKEELFGILYLILAILSFGFNFTVSGIIFLVLAALNFIGSIYYAVKYIKSKE